MTTEELASILQVERLRPSEPHQHPRVSQRTETSPELLAPCLSYITPSSSSPWKLRPIPWKAILFSPVFSRMQPAWSLALRIVREYPVFFLPWTECLPSWALFELYFTLLGSQFYICSAYILKNLILFMYTLIYMQKEFEKTYNKGNKPWNEYNRKTIRIKERRQTWGWEWFLRLGGGGSYLLISVAKKQKSCCGEKGEIS